MDHLANHIGSEHKSLLYEWVFAYEFSDKAAADKSVKDAKLTESLEQVIRGINIVDPACGSGSFLSWHRVLFDAAEGVWSLRAYIALESAILFELSGMFSSASRGFGQDG